MENNKIQTSFTQTTPEWKLKLAYFYAEHKSLIKRGWIFFLFFIDIIIVFSLGSILVNYQTGLISDNNKLKGMYLNLVNSDAINKQKPETLVWGEVKIMPLGDNQYNLMVSVKNNNQRWAVTRLEYTFEVNGGYLEPRTSFILPKSEKYLMYFNAAAAQDASLTVLDTNWQRIKDFSLLSYKDEVVVRDSQYIPSRLENLSGQLKFTLVNNSPYNFWQVGLPIVLYSHDAEPLAIDYIMVDKLLAKETRKISTLWHESINQRVRQVDIHPEINLLDKNVVMKIEGKGSSPPGLE